MNCRKFQIHELFLMQIIITTYTVTSTERGTVPLLLLVPLLTNNFIEKTLIQIVKHDCICVLIKLTSPVLVRHTYRWTYHLIMSVMVMSPYSWYMCLHQLLQVIPCITCPSCNQMGFPNSAVTDDDALDVFRQNGGRVRHTGHLLSVPDSDWWVFYIEHSA